jgi:hypothetical protein
VADHLRKVVPGITAIGLEGGYKTHGESFFHGREKYAAVAV